MLHLHHPKKSSFPRNRLCENSLSRWREREGPAKREGEGGSQFRKEISISWETERRTTLTPTLSRQREREFSHSLFRGNDDFLG